MLRFLKKNDNKNLVIDSLENQWWKLALPTSMGADRGSEKQGDIEVNFADCVSWVLSLLEGPKTKLHCWCYSLLYVETQTPPCGASFPFSSEGLFL